MDIHNIKTEIIGNLKVGQRFQYLKGRAIYEIMSVTMGSVRFAHITTGEEFKGAALSRTSAKQRYFAEVKIV